MSDTIQIWMKDDRPARLVYRGARWRVIDMPTPLAQELDWHPLITHVPTVKGWRCVARRETDREVRTFDLVPDGGAWFAVKVRD